MTNPLTHTAFRATFGNRMSDVTLVEMENPVDIWSYVEQLSTEKLVGKNIVDQQFVEHVYRNDLNTYDHVLLPTQEANVFTVIVVDLKRREVYGHTSLDLNDAYGLM